MTAKQPPPRPIIYVRGYAMRDKEIDDTTADPFCGFNLGSAVYRAVPDRNDDPKKYVFESPIVRLMSEFGYDDVFRDGHDIVDPEWEFDANGRRTGNVLSARSIIIYRYYEATSRLLGTGKTPDIRKFASELGDLIIKVRRLVCENASNKIDPAGFRCHLVAHSMGGLICRAMLQNPALDTHGASRFVDKFFTYATPHNGIELAGVNVPGWLSLNDISNFNRGKEMRDYLDLKAAYRKHDRVDLIPEDRFPSRKVFCMVGTNRMDYEAAAGLSRTFVGNGSDGLVRIENATLHGLNADGSIGNPCAKAFAYRSHSGYFGIVNSEEAYQNLTRFLFGDVRVDVWLDIHDIRLPQSVRDAIRAGKKVNALFQVEMHAAPKGMLWMLTRRKIEEDSPSCFSYADFLAVPVDADGRRVCRNFLSSVFLAKYAMVDPKAGTLTYFMSLGLRVPDYEIDRKIWKDQHYEGGYLFQNSILVTIAAPKGKRGQWMVKYAWQDSGQKSPDQLLTVDEDQFLNGGCSLEIPVVSQSRNERGDLVETTPGISATLRLQVSAWE